MNRNTKLICWAFSISFAGSLPLGTLNLSVANYTLHHDLTGAIGFSAAAIAVEIIIVRLSLLAVSILAGIKRFYTLFKSLICLILIAMAINMFITSGGISGDAHPVISLHPVLAGLILSVVNPLHLPFWMGWTAVLRSKGILEQSSSAYNRLIAGIGAGTALAFTAYGTIGSYLISLIGRQQERLNLMMGIGFLLTALVQIFKMLPAWKKGVYRENSGTDSIV
ncbi:LysE family transporter [Chitinophaga filiformis]|uniref:Threonine/homoserine/homoserine lactone efflux protein n=1 Tax=Chitinophaga filiformis TaxID=104663 RepID=A0ABY4HZK8_CHIFI|nr:LysE family transporter [Chitinophaga filiformis]UPK68459.1 hypothetical protein MYF79_26240 [Chitinophaga filiformis]